MMRRRNRRVGNPAPDSATRITESTSAQITEETPDGQAELQPADGHDQLDHAAIQDHSPPTVITSKSAHAVETTNTSRIRRSGGTWLHVSAYGVLPVLSFALALAAGWLKWQCAIANSSNLAQAQSIQAATESTVAMLSYKPDTVEKDLD